MEQSASEGTTGLVGCPSLTLASNACTTQGTQACPFALLGERAEGWACLLAAVGVWSLLPQLPRAALTFGRANMWPLGPRQARAEALNAVWCFPFPSGLAIFTEKPKRQAFGVVVGGRAPGTLLLFPERGLSVDLRTFTYLPSLPILLASSSGPHSPLRSLAESPFCVVLYISQHGHQNKWAKSYLFRSRVTTPAEA